MLSDSRRTTELNYTEVKSWPNYGAKLAYIDALPNYKNKTVLFFVFIFCYFQYGFFSSIFGVFVKDISKTYIPFVVLFSHMNRARVF